MTPTDSPRRTAWVQAAGVSAALTLAPRLDDAVIRGGELRSMRGPRVAGLSDGGVESTVLPWAWETVVGARTVGASRAGTSSARPITRRTRAGRSLTDRTRRSGW